MTDVAHDRHVHALSSTVVVLVRTEGPLNVGSVARLCGNFGCGLRLVDVSADTTSKHAVMMAHPAEQVLLQAQRFATLDEALRDVDASIGTSSKIVDARDGPVFDVARARGFLPAAGCTVAVVFGNERTGLSVGEAACCTRLVKLPTPGTNDSLNLSHAVACVLTLLAQAQRDSATDVTSAPRAAADARAVLVTQWLAALELRGYFKAQRPERFLPRLREIVDKMDISDRDVVLLRDMLHVLAHGAAPKQERAHG